MGTVSHVRRRHPDLQHRATEAGDDRDMEVERAMTAAWILPRSPFALPKDGSSPWLHIHRYGSSCSAARPCRIGPIIKGEDGDNSEEVDMEDQVEIGLSQLNDAPVES
ncbi:hypothetical protein E2562_013859 [Oryza meyeriana var. granulata]|uniref:Uncharacterized protein n=1 Tax=Oryza meyeriana var. granulata TaxID=110450 RepID=A0A6G1C7I1_9ORYZ|nr:hypothetical protein E2562_013859 [Oryza meyeriana var. granulata]